MRAMTCRFGPHRRFGQLERTCSTNGRPVSWPPSPMHALSQHQAAPSRPRIQVHARKQQARTTLDPTLLPCFPPGSQQVTRHTCGNQPFFIGRLPSRAVGRRARRRRALAAPPRAQPLQLFTVEDACTAMARQEMASVV
jgi:hypothetical protein